ncbi:MAG: elongation factor G [Planctomycetota bacterium]|nr:elongation factor G [Planctomycetota bacterium]
MDRARLRNFGVAAHIDAGKTTTSEQMLYHAGVELRAGIVDEGTTVLDWMAEERERGITITSAATSLEWRGHHLNLVDTPGHVDFTVEVERCMRVLDGAVLVLDGVAGVQAQSETVWRQIDRHQVPCVAFVNKMDKPGADFTRVVESMGARLGVRAVAIQAPLLVDDLPLGVIDLITREAWRFQESSPKRLPVDVPSELVDEVEIMRMELVDALVAEDEALFEGACEGVEPEVGELKRALRASVIDRSLIPVLCGAAVHGVGVESVLDAVVDYLPSPLDLPSIRTQEMSTGQHIELPCDPAGSLAALCFKLQVGALEDLCFLRLYSGSLRSGSVVHNPRTGKEERVLRMMRIHADGGEEVAEAAAGDILAVEGLRETVTGDTLCEAQSVFTLEGVEFPVPVITRVVEPLSAADREGLRVGLERLAYEDPSLHVVEEESSGQWSVKGMGELHLEVLEHRLKTDFKVDARFGEPRVAYREFITASQRGEASVDRLINEQAVFAKVSLEVAPSLEGQEPGVCFSATCLLEEKWRHAVEEALLKEADAGPRFGFPLANVAVRVLSADSREGAEGGVGFALAAVLALREALVGAEVAVEEPLMRIRIAIPGEFSSGVIADLNTRSAELDSVQAEGKITHIGGSVPLFAMFGYSTAVRSLSQGRGEFSMEPIGYKAVTETELVERGYR